MGTKENGATLEAEAPVAPVEQVAGGEPKETDEEATARLKAAVFEAHSGEAVAIAVLKEAKRLTAETEHAFCEHLFRVRGGSLKAVEVEIGGLRYKPKFFETTDRYRLDRVLTHERVTV